MLTRGRVCRLIALLLAAVALGCGTLASAQSVRTEFFSVTLPIGWTVKSDPTGAIATPLSDAELPRIAIDSCDRNTKANCPQSCETDSLRSNYFYFLANDPTAIYSEKFREDGFRDLRASGSVGSPATWVAASVLCGSKGIVYIGAMSLGSRSDAGDLVEATVQSLRW